MKKIKNKKLIPIIITGAMVLSIWTLLILIPLFNDLIKTINDLVPSNYRLPIGLSVITIITLSFSFLTWKFIAPKLKEMSSTKFDKPSLAVVMSGSSGSGIFRAFKNVKDSKFSSVIKGVLFDVERDASEVYNGAGAIHALRFPVQPAQTGFKGAINARNIEYDNAKKSFLNFFKPFAKRINAVVRITGIGRGYTSVSTASKFDFLDFSNLSVSDSLTLFDFIIVDREKKDSIEKKNKKSENRTLVRINGENTSQNGVIFPEESVIVTPLDGLFLDGFFDDLTSINSSGEVNSISVKNVDDSLHIAFLNLLDRSNLTKSTLGVQEKYKRNLSLGEAEKGQIVQVNHLSKTGLVTTQTEIAEINNDLGIIQTKDQLNSNEEFGSALTSLDGKLLGIAMPSPEMNHFLSSKIIKARIIELNSQKEELIK